jgi:DNA polymerase III subunit delta'
MRFADVIGHQDEKKNLARSAREGRIAHAQLFVGQEGGGNLPMALAYVQYLNCAQRTETDSCGTCDSCRKISNLAHPDLHWVFPFVADGTGDTCSRHMDAFREAVLSDPYLDLGQWIFQSGNAGKQPAINVATCNSIFKTLSMKPYEAQWQFMMIWYPETMNLAGANKLLKIIEEPPAHTVFILISSSEEQILPTIQSRTQRVKLKRIPDFDMLSALSEQFGVSLERGQELVPMADGNYGRAMRLVNAEDERLQFFPLFQDWMRVCYTATFLRGTQLAEDFHKLGREGQMAVLEYGLHIMREALIFVHQPTILRISEKERHWLSKFAPVLKPEQIQGIAELIEQATYRISRNAYAKLTFLSLTIEIHHVFRYGAKRST